VTSLEWAAAAQESTIIDTRSSAVSFPPLSDAVARARFLGHESLCPSDGPESPTKTEITKQSECNDRRMCWCNDCRSCMQVF
jgi:hypothetical protein